MTAPQETYDALSTRRINNKDEILKDEVICERGLRPFFEMLISNQEVTYQLEKEMQWIQQVPPIKSLFGGSSPYHYTEITETFRKLLFATTSLSLMTMR
ncbi:MAG: hypothetical protein ACUVRD_09260 [Bacteroidia bacterium]